MKTRSALLVLAVALAASSSGLPAKAAETPAGTAIPVTPDNFVRAESDRYLGALVKESGLGKFEHRRVPAPIESQTVIRLNRDTLYSSIVLDLDAGPATITLPETGNRFVSMQVIDEDQYTHAVHCATSSPTGAWRGA